LASNTQIQTIAPNPHKKDRAQGPAKSNREVHVNKPDMPGIIQHLEVQTTCLVDLYQSYQSTILTKKDPAPRPGQSNREVRGLPATRRYLV